jgi:crotonobetainyl-CoA:carnitine CoA-transferase CaiB-like acyl-CoA transferase
MGARVVKIEPPVAPGTVPANRNAPPFLGRDGLSMARRHADDVSLSALQRLRGVESITLDLKKPGARELLHELVARADILFENLSRGTAARLGAGFDELIAVNPALVYTSISGTGQEDRSGSGKTIDTVVQALSGLMMTSGSEGEPPVRHGVPFADLVTPLYAVIGTLAALHEARTTGRGQHVDVSMLGAITSLVAGDFFDVLTAMGAAARTGRTVPRLAPLGIYPAADRYVALCTVSDARFQALTRAMGQPELATDPRFATRAARVQHYQEIDAIVTAWTQVRPAAEITAILDEFKVPAGPVRTTSEALSDPRVRARGEVVPLRHPLYPSAYPVYGAGLPIRFGEGRYPEEVPIPRCGEHNDAVYRDLLGCSDARLASLQAAGVI